MKYSILIILVVLSFGSISAHEGGHGVPSKQWELTTTDRIIKADFISYENGEVWLMDGNHTIQTFQITDFAQADQNYIKTKNKFIHSLNNSTAIEADSQSLSIFNWVLIGLGILLLSFSIFKLIKQKKVVYLTHGVLGLGVILIVSCKNTSATKTSTTQVPANNVSLMQIFFEKFDGVTTHSDAKYLYVSSNGLPNHYMMVGITNWQQQVPIK
ncbi:hypothetical protein [uncultured Maribacter sp.]|uniref:hypothetical protein n=1 Tax=uncultured Maribacter sp. TaxID=431308 RepID=UPI0030ED9519|tara:strand:- start:81018 stop:81656 length:639 start_codon:yes stop_codon:yes gene_type:complete